MERDIDTICTHLCEFLSKHILAEGIEFDRNRAFSDLDVDSLSLIELLLFVERRFGIRIPESHLTRENLHSVAALAHCVLELDQGKGAECGSSSHDDAESNPTYRR